MYKTGINNSSEKFAAKWRNGAVTGGYGRVIKAVIDHGFWSAEGKRREGSLLDDI